MNAFVFIMLILAVGMGLSITFAVLFSKCNIQNKIINKIFLLLTICPLLLTAVLTIAIPYLFDHNSEIDTGSIKPMSVVKTDQLGTVYYCSDDNELEEKSMSSCNLMGRDMQLLQADIDHPILCECESKYGFLTIDDYLYVYPSDQSKLTTDEYIAITKRTQNGFNNLV